MPLLKVPIGQGCSYSSDVPAGQKWPTGHTFTKGSDVFSGQKNLHVLYNNSIDVHRTFKNSCKSKFF